MIAGFLLCWVLPGHDISSEALKSKKFVMSYDMVDMSRDVTETSHVMKVIQMHPGDMTCRDMRHAVPIVIVSSSVTHH